MIPLLNFLYSGVLRSHREISAWYSATGMQKVQWALEPVRIRFACCSFTLTPRCPRCLISRFFQPFKQTRRTPGPTASLRMAAANKPPTYRQTSPPRCVAGSSNSPDKIADLSRRQRVVQRYFKKLFLCNFRDFSTCITNTDAFVV